MRQFQTAYQDAQSFRETVNAWQSWRKDHGAGQALFHVLSDGPTRMRSALPVPYWKR